MTAVYVIWWIRDDAIGQLQSGFKVTSHPRFNVEQRSVQFEPELFKSFSFHIRSLRSEQGEQNTNGQMTRKLCESNWPSCQLWNNFYTSNHFVSHFYCFNWNCIIVCERSLWTNAPDDDLRNPILTSHDIITNFSVNEIRRTFVRQPGALELQICIFMVVSLRSPTHVSKSTECIFVFVFTFNQNRRGERELQI